MKLGEWILRLTSSLSLFNRSTTSSAKLLTHVETFGKWNGNKFNWITHKLIEKIDNWINKPNPIK